MDPKNANGRLKKINLREFVKIMEGSREYEETLQKAFTGLGNGFDQQGKALENLRRVDYDFRDQPTQCLNALDVKIDAGDRDMIM